MENSQRRNYWIDVALVVLMLVVVLSIALIKAGGRSVMHCVAGAALVALAIRHLVCHIEWIRKVYTTRRKDLPRKVRTHRRNDLLLFVWLSLCGISGLRMWIFGPSEALRHLHMITAGLAFITMLFHIGYHMRWLIRSTRRYVLNGEQGVSQEQPERVGTGR